MTFIKHQQTFFEPAWCQYMKTIVLPLELFAPVPLYVIIIISVPQYVCLAFPPFLFIVHKFYFTCLNIVST